MSGLDSWLSNLVQPPRDNDPEDPTLIDANGEGYLTIPNNHYLANLLVKAVSDPTTSPNFYTGSADSVKERWEFVRSFADHMLNGLNQREAELGISTDQLSMTSENIDASTSSQPMNNVGTECSSITFGTEIYPAYPPSLDVPQLLNVPIPASEDMSLQHYPSGSESCFLSSEYSDSLIFDEDEGHIVEISSLSSEDSGVIMVGRRAIPSIARPQMDPRETQFLHRTRDSRVKRSKAPQIFRSVDGKERFKPDDQRVCVKVKKGRPSDRGECCIRCRLQNKGCTGGKPCDRCKAPRFAQVCKKAEFSDSRAFPRVLYSRRATNLSANVDEWFPRQSAVPVIIRVSNGFETSFEVELDKYRPKDPRALTHVLFRGLEAGGIPPKAESTAFAIRSASLPPEVIDDYLDRLIPFLIEKVGKEHKPSLVNYVLLHAHLYIQPSGEARISPAQQLVQLALRFWAIQSVFFVSQWTIAEGAVLVGMVPLNIPGFWNGITLLPRLLNQQLDKIFEERMNSLETEVLERLGKAIFRQRKELWYSIFLASFLVLHSLERDSWNLHAWDTETKRLGGTKWEPERRPLDYHDQNQHIAELVTAHFRAVNNGNVPFKVDWLRKCSSQKLVNHDPTILEFIKRVIEMKEVDDTILTGCSGQGFSRSDVGSLDYLFSKRLILD